MNLDNLELFKQLDTQNRLAEINALPDQLQSAWDLSATLPLPNIPDVQNIIVCAMGDSALAADLVSASVFAEIRLPLIVHRDYGLPAFARGKQTLVVCVSHTGADEETLDAFQSALKNDCSVFVISAGNLAKLAAEKNIAAWNLPNAGVAASFALLLALFSRMGFIADPSADITEAVSAMKKSQERLREEEPAVTNPAKRYAGQMVGRWITLVGAGAFAPVARRWKTQINQLAKAGANFEILPEANHNALSATLNPTETLNAHTMTMFLRAPSDHPRNRSHANFMRQTFMLEGLNVDAVEARGESAMAHIWTLILFGDYMAYYLAMAYGVDPAQ
ncbi:MAG: SIS domain-containing protein [Anaerolineales bacterium]|nr:SIS domain-containing protein [Anaerolineales bacterium]